MLDTAQFAFLFWAAAAVALCSVIAAVILEHVLRKMFRRSKK